MIWILNSGIEKITKIPKPTNCIHGRIRELNKMIFIYIRKITDQ